MKSTASLRSATTHRMNRQHAWWHNCSRSWTVSLLQRMSLSLLRPIDLRASMSHYYGPVVSTGRYISPIPTKPIEKDILLKNCPRAAKLESLFLTDVLQPSRKGGQGPSLQPFGPKLHCWRLKTAGVRSTKKITSAVTNGGTATESSPERFHRTEVSDECWITSAKLAPTPMEPKDQ